MLHLLRRHRHLRSAGLGLDAQQALELFADVGRPGVFQDELPHQPFLARRRLLAGQHRVHFPQVGGRVQRFQAVGGLQRRQLAVGAEHRLEFFHGRLGDHPVQRERDLDELVRQAIGQFLGLDARHQAGVEFSVLATDRTSFTTSSV